MSVQPFIVGKVQPVLDHLNEQFAGHLQLEYHGRTVGAKLTGPDAEILLSSTEPVRPQLIAELRRVARFLNYLATVMADSDWSDGEQDADELHRTIIELYDLDDFRGDVVGRVSA